jgi:hypothetical protein
MSGETKRTVKKLAPGAPAVDPDRAWLTLERKYRVAQYESLTVNLGAATAVQPGEDLPEAMKRLFRELREEFSDVLEAMREQEGV